MACYRAIASSSPFAPSQYLAKESSYRRGLHLHLRTQQ